MYLKPLWWGAAAAALIVTAGNPARAQRGVELGVSSGRAHNIEGANWLEQRTFIGGRAGLILVRRSRTAVLLEVRGGRMSRSSSVSITCLSSDNCGQPDAYQLHGAIGPSVRRGISQTVDVQAGLAIGGLQNGYRDRAGVEFPQYDTGRKTSLSAELGLGYSRGAWRLATMLEGGALNHVNAGLAGDCLNGTPGPANQPCHTVYKDKALFRLSLLLSGRLSAGRQRQ